MKYIIGTVTGIVLAGSAAMAAPVNTTGNVTPDVIMGTGIANGDFTGVTENGIELALRGKLRYNTAGNAENTFNYDGDRTYTFTTAEGNAPGAKSIFNYEWSINVDPDDQNPTNLNLNDLTYLFQVDYDPTVNTDFVSFDAINIAFADHSIGSNSTGNGGGIEAAYPGIYSLLISTRNVAQNSWNLDNMFIAPPGADTTAEGMFTIALSAFDANGARLASTSIDIIYGDIPAPVPLPAALPLLAGALGGLGFVARRRRRKS